jgi:hypothetical protein
MNVTLCDECHRKTIFLIFLRKKDDARWVSTAAPPKSKAASRDILNQKAAQPATHHRACSPDLEIRRNE